MLLLIRRLRQWRGAPPQKSLRLHYDPKKLLFFNNYPSHFATYDYCFSIIMNNPSSLPRYARELDAALSIATWLTVAVMFGTLFAAVAYFVLPPLPEPLSMSVNFPISQPAPWPVDSAERNGKLVYREATLNLPAANFPVFFRMAMPLNAILLPSLALVAILKLRAVVRTVR